MQNLIQKLRDLKPRLDAAVDNFLSVKKNRVFARVLCCVAVVLIIFLLISPILFFTIRASAEEGEPSVSPASTYEISDLSHIAFVGHLYLPQSYDSSNFDLNGVVWFPRDNRYFYFDEIGIYSEPYTSFCTLSLFVDNVSVHTVWPDDEIVIYFVGGEDSLDASALSLFNSQLSLELLGNDIPSSLVGFWAYEPSSWSFGVSEYDLDGFFYDPSNIEHPFAFNRLVGGYSLDLGANDEYFTMYFDEIGFSFRSSVQYFSFYITGGDDVNDPFLCLLSYIYSINYSPSPPDFLSGWILIDNEHYSSSPYPTVHFGDFPAWLPFISTKYRVVEIIFEEYPIYYFEDGSSFSLDESSPLEYYLLWVLDEYPLYLEPGSFAADHFSSYVPGSFDFDIGYETGFTDGYGEGLASSFLGDFFGGILEGLDSLDIVFGYSILAMISAVLGIMFTLWILKLVAGG